MSKILFWIVTIALGFISPLISFGLLVLYYLLGIMRDLSQTNSNEFDNDQNWKSSSEKTQSFQMNSFSKDTLEESR